MKTYTMEISTPQRSHFLRYFKSNVFHLAFHLALHLVVFRVKIPILKLTTPILVQESERFRVFLYISII